MSDRTRLAREEDAAQILDIYAPIVSGTAISFEFEPPSEGEIRRRVRSLGETHPWLVRERDDRIIGYAYASPFRSRPAYQWTAETTLYIDQEHRRQGVGQALYEALLCCLATQGFRSLVGVIALPNPASVALHESFGFRSAGLLPAAGHKFSTWHDIGIWQLKLQDLSEPPPRPRPVNDLFEELGRLGIGR